MEAKNHFERIHNHFKIREKYFRDKESKNEKLTRYSMLNSETIFIKNYLLYNIA